MGNAGTTVPDPQEVEPLPQEVEPLLQEVEPLPQVFQPLLQLVEPLLQAPVPSPQLVVPSNCTSPAGFGSGASASAFLLTVLTAGSLLGGAVLV